MSVPGQSTSTYGYDDVDRMTRITRGANEVLLGYDAVGRRQTLTLPNGIVATHAYDDAGQLVGIQYSRGSSTLGDLTYAYDAAGQRIEMGGSFARMTLPQPLSNAAYNAANRLTNWEGVAQTYDLNGNLTNDGSRTYTWDTRNRLSGITGGATAAFKYDGTNRRYEKTVAGVATGFLYDGLNPVHELTGTTTAVKASLMTGPGLDQFFARIDTAGTSSMITDGLGSTIALADINGAVATKYTYEPYGKTTPIGAASENAFQYTGRENDGTGLYYYRARYYDPAKSRFLSEYPIGLAGGINTYAYVRGNPTGAIDPSGLETIVIINNNGMVGTHSGVIAGDTLYDPGGDYKANAGRGSDDTISGSDVDLSDYLKYQERDGSDVDTYRFPTTPDQEAEIQKNIEKRGACFPGMCARCTSGVLDGIGPFKDLGTSWTPSGLGRALKGVIGK